jgi:Pentapeptide repeats (8 copies)
MDLTGVDLFGVDLSEANLSGALLFGAHLSAGRLTRANLTGADLNEAHLNEANLIGANLNEAYLIGAQLNEANLNEANLIGAHLNEAHLSGAKLSGAHLIGADLSGANLSETNLNKANLSNANLDGANLRGANLSGADLSGVNLNRTELIGTDFSGANLTGSSIYGIAAWDVKLSASTQQKNLIITPPGQPIIAVDNIKVAQFVYLLLNNEEIRDVIDTVGRKGVLLLGRFTDDRIAVLERLRAELRKRGFVPMVFNFDKPEVKDFTETIRLLASLSHFVIADITNPRSTPLELQATIPECMVPFIPILERGEEPFAMFRDLWIKHREWVFEPIRYPSLDRLIEVLDVEIVHPAQAMFANLLAKKAEELRVRDI